jgi:hypothetical protein
MLDARMLLATKKEATKDVATEAAASCGTTWPGRPLLRLPPARSTYVLLWFFQELRQTRRAGPYIFRALGQESKKGPH